jgi:hypothetical protein
VSRKSKLRSEGLVALTTWHPLSAKVGTSFADRRRSLDRYGSLADSKPRSSFIYISNILCVSALCLVARLVGRPKVMYYFDFIPSFCKSFPRATRVHHSAFILDNKALTVYFCLEKMYNLKV